MRQRQLVDECGTTSETAPWSGNNDLSCGNPCPEQTSTKGLFFNHFFVLPGLEIGQCRCVETKVITPSRSI